MTAEERRDKDRARWRAYDALHRHERRERDRSDYAANPDKHRAKNRAYHAKRREAILARSRARYAVKREADLARKRARRRANPSEGHAYRLAYYAAHADECRAMSRAYTIAQPEKRRAWRDKHRERLTEYAAQWSRTNPGRKRAATARRLAAKLRATPVWADLTAIRIIYEEAARLSKETGIPHEVDHIVPLKSQIVCGLHVQTNMQILTKTANRRKWNRLIST